MRKNTSGPRFKALLEAANISTTGFAKFWGTEAQNVHNWYTRGVPAYRMEEVARLLSVNSQWLKTGEGPKEAPHLHAAGTTLDAQAIQGVYTVIESSDIELPLYKETPTAPGSGKTHVIKDPEQTIRLPRSHLEALEIRPTDAICTHMIGNSMAEKIEDGSTLAIDRGLTQVVDGEIYAIEHDGMLRIKYLHRMPGNALRLRSHNSAEYPDEIFRASQIEEQRIHVLGWVFWWSTLGKRRPVVPFL
ncbi:S24 family peptidase [Pseudomonas sp. 22105]|uniref:Helix-turn-helix transcriptional regulator n=1 Tax=Pseudomonas glycinae TaxID=1785145 RepID=A0ABM5ZMS6_9PSED|nr:MULTISPECIES: helix-turn-helix transcriptional regulator [Pseudomonas]AMQ84960.1 helix-turn-helix transcriptional regulator [Pseudomonas glycinae]NKF27727.1 helix-turn-helix transcriptional regulator [Pseudomonas sp. BG5]